MKKEYSKPTIHVEILSLDTPIAGACTTSLDLEFPEFSALGWFVGDGCQYEIDGMDADDVLQKVDDKGNTVCYHSQTGIVIQS